jgi:hypothetical protein
MIDPDRLRHGISYGLTILGLCLVIILIAALVASGA